MTDTMPNQPTDDELLTISANVPADGPDNYRRAGRRALYERGTNDGFTIAHLGLAAQLTEAARETAEERDRQDAKWGEQNHPDGTGPTETPLLAPLRTHSIDAHDPAWRIAAELTAQTDEAAAAGTVTWRDILLEETFEALAESDPARLRKELIQVAAVAQQWVEAIDRRTSALAAPARI
jgi:hypothetical protein